MDRYQYEKLKAALERPPTRRHAPFDDLHEDWHCAPDDADAEMMKGWWHERGDKVLEALPTWGRHVVIEELFKDRNRRMPPGPSHGNSYFIDELKAARRCAGSAVRALLRHARGMSPAIFASYLQQRTLMSTALQRSAASWWEAIGRRVRARIPVRDPWFKDKLEAGTRLEIRIAVHEIKPIARGCAAPGYKVRGATKIAKLMAGEISREDVRVITTYPPSGTWNTVMVRNGALAKDVAEALERIVVFQAETPVAFALTTRDNTVVFHIPLMLAHQFARGEPVPVPGGGTYRLLGEVVRVDDFNYRVLPNESGGLIRAERGPADPFWVPPAIGGPALLDDSTPQFGFNLPSDIFTPDDSRDEEEETDDAD